MLCEPVQQFGLLAGSPMPAKQALLQPTGKPVESKGPLSAAGPKRGKEGYDERPTPTGEEKK